MNALTDILVRLDGPWDPTGAELVEHPGEGDHIDVILEAASAETLADTTALQKLSDEERQQIRGASWYVAGVLARLAVIAADWIELDCRRHGCGPLQPTGESDPLGAALYGDIQCCRVYGEILFDLPFWDWSPSLTLTVPYGQQKVWLDRIASWLTKLAEMTP